jgi:alpha-tubulin suppressor-like RCC1 family protein
MGFLAALRIGGCRSRSSATAVFLAALLVALMMAVASPAGAVPFVSVKAWGYNGEGQLGNGTTTSSTTPRPVSGLGEDVSAISAGLGGGLALLTDGTVVHWGNGTLAPTAVGGLSEVVAVSGGAGGLSLALLGNGTVMQWSNEHPVPAPVSGLGGVASISAGSNFGLALLSDGTVKAWGGNQYGQLGDGGFAPSESPVAVSGLSGVRSVSAGYDHALALLSGGEVRAWGENAQGQLGNGSKTASDLPVEVCAVGTEGSCPIGPFLSGVSAVSATNATHSLALLEGGTAVAWGLNDAGQLGDGSGENRDVPVDVTGLSGATALVAGSGESLARLSDGTAMSWGRNLGNGSVTPSSVPAPVSKLIGVIGVAGGGSYSLVHLAPNPRIARLSTQTGPPAGGTAVTITGASFTGATAVRFGSAHAASFTVNSATSISAVSPAGTGSVNVTVTTPVGVSVLSIADQFSYGAAPRVTSLSAKTGTSAGGTSVTITGVNFSGATAVAFGSTGATFTVESPTSITAVSPGGIAGTVGDVIVTNSEGASAPSPSDHFTYGVPTITEVSPNSGPKTGGTTVTISGSGFAPGPTGTIIQFAGVPAASTECASTTTCVVVTPNFHPGSFPRNEVRVGVRAKVGKKSSVKTPAASFTFFGETPP